MTTVSAEDETPILTCEDEQETIGLKISIDSPGNVTIDEFGITPNTVSPMDLWNAGRSTSSIFANMGLSDLKNTEKMQERYSKSIVNLRHAAR